MLALVQLVHLSGPSTSTCNFFNRHVKKQIRQSRAWGYIVYFWQKGSTNAKLSTTGGREGSRGIVRLAHCAMIFITALIFLRHRREN
jgi:hypothetical protein